MRSDGVLAVSHDYRRTDLTVLRMRVTARRRTDYLLSSTCIELFDKHEHQNDAKLSYGLRVGDSVYRAPALLVLRMDSNAIDVV